MIEPGTIIQILVASGLLAVVGETFRWFMGRGKAKVDSAKVVQGMAIDLVKPLHEELARAEIVATRLRGNLRDMENDMADFLVWATEVRNILERERIEYPPLPKMRIRH